MTKQTHLWIWISVLASCSSEVPCTTGESIELVQANNWDVLGVVDDPWKAERPDEVTCTTLGFHAEGDAYVEVDTADCNWLSASQALTTPVEQGDTIQLSAWHLTLISPEEAEAVMSVRIGDETIWELREPLSSDSVIEPATFSIVHQLQDSWPAGTPVYLHVHNHGANSYVLSSIAVDDECMDL